MSGPEPRKHWWTPDELAAAGLPEMPGSKRGINLLAERLGWRQVAGGARRKPGRGGGWQYHWSVLPLAARRALLADAAEGTEAVAGGRPDRGAAWAAFDALPASAKEKARARLVALQMAETLHSSGLSHVAAMDEAARIHDVSTRTLYNWHQMVDGVTPEDRLAYLAPRNRLVARKTAKASCTRAFMEHLKSLYLRLEQPTFRQCYRMACRQAEAMGWEVLRERTAQRRLDAEVPRVTRVFARHGVAGLERCYPSQIRDRSAMSALEAVNADCHKIDVFVRWPDGTVNRPQIVAFQDLYSNKMLSWRVDHSPNKVMVMAAFGELVETWGIPRRCLFDNGREFANKWMTGGTPTRFRFKVREDDPLGVLPLLGIEVRWAQPAHGHAARACVDQRCCPGAEGLGPAQRDRFRLGGSPDASRRLQAITCRWGIAGRYPDMKKPLHPVSDHAVLRYLERVCDMDIEAVRREIGRRVDLSHDHPGACGVISGGFVYKLQGGVVTTVMVQNRADLRTGRQRRDGGDD